MFDDNVMELLLVIAQHAHAVSITSFINPDAHPACKVTKSSASIGVHTVTYGHGVTYLLACMAFARQSKCATDVPWDNSYGIWLS